MLMRCLQAGLFSAALTAFIIDGKQNLKANPADQTVYYLQQNVAILSQISKQISSVVPQVSIPSTPPAPFTFNLSASDVRVNAFWFMALIFSLSAALLATLVQQWVRDYMHVFQRYSDPLKSARIRQYLHEGCEGWYMPVVAEAVPGLLHTSVFLFFVGLGDFILNINTTVGLSTTIPIGIAGLLYIFTTFAPVIYPQSPYQNSFSGLIWYLIQTLRVWRYKDREGKSKSVSSNMVEGQMQLAMQETKGRRDRDARAIRGLLDSLTEDSELESFTMAIPGSFNGEWGFKVWTRVFRSTEDKDRRAQRIGHPNGPPSATVLNAAFPPIAQPSPRFKLAPNPFRPIIRLLRTRTASRSRTIALLPIQHSPATHLPLITTSTHQGDVVRDLSRRINHLFETCKNRGSFASDELWRRRMRACVEAAASLVIFADAELDWFGNIGRLLRDIGKLEKTRELSSAGMDQSFVTRWTCLSIMVTRSMLKCNSTIQETARHHISVLEHPCVDADGKPVTYAALVDIGLSGSWRHLIRICIAMFGSPIADLSPDSVRGVLRTLPSQMFIMGSLYRSARSFKVLDDGLSSHQRSVHLATDELICELPGVEFDGDRPDPLPFSQAAEMLNNPALLYTLIGQCSVGLSSICPKLQDILEGGDSERFQETLQDLKSFPWKEAIGWEGNVVQRQQLWRCQDLCSGGGLGFTVEIFLISLKQLLSTSSSKDSQSAMYVGTFRAITSDWSVYKHSLATQNLLLHTVASHNGIISKFNYPAYITDELLVLVYNMFKEQRGPHIDHAVELLANMDPDAQGQAEFYHGPPDFRARALEVILQAVVERSAFARAFVFVLLSHSHRSNRVQ